MSGGNGREHVGGTVTKASEAMYNTVDSFLAIT